MTESTRPDATPFRDRRAALARRLRETGGGVALIPTAPERTRNSDVEHPYRFSSDFHYLTGFAEPGAWLVLEASGRSTVFCRPRDPERELWDGLRLGVEAAPGALGVDAAFDIGTLDEQLPLLLKDQPTLWRRFGADEVLTPARLETWSAALRRRARDGWLAPVAERDLSPLLDDLRLRKDAQEARLMRRAGEISAGAHARAMRYAARRLREGAGFVTEYEIEAELLHEFRRHGASGPAYPSIVAAGANACILHYAAANARLEPGQLCLIDAGCEYEGYASDITRTWPADGRFSGEQRALYDLVLAAQDAALAETRPGARQRDAHHAAVRVLSQGLLDLGLLDRSRVGDVEAVIDTAAYRAFYMHGTGHWLGRDVHDVGDYLDREEAPFEQPDGLGGRVVRPPARRLEPGMVVTVEPGLYVRPADGVPERFWNIGIRIEDDALLTPEGHELLSRGVPVKAEEIEAWMRG